MPGKSRRGDGPTSTEAAERLDAGALERMVLGVLIQYGPPRGIPMCVVEIWHRLPQLSVDSISPRLVDLIRMGLVFRYKDKQPRQNRYGNTRNQFVHRITTDEEREALRREARAQVSQQVSNSDTAVERALQALTKREP